METNRNKMKKLKAVSIFISVMTLIYLAIAFANWDLNPAEWSDFARGVGAFNSLIFGCMFSIFYYENN